MTSKEKKLKAVIELALVGARIEELNRSKTYMNSSTYFRNRLRILEEKGDKLRDIIDGSEQKELRLVFHLPELLLKGSERPEDLLQFMKKEYLVEV